MDDMDPNEPLDLVHGMMMRGWYLQNLRRLAEEDEDQRNQDAIFEHKDEIVILPSGCKLIKYESYLQHQTYYDDLKHANFRFIEYGNFIGGNKGLEDQPILIIEQDKGLGKGGLCWDAAFILGEYLISNDHIWNNKSSTDHQTRVLELGGGTGLTGMMIAKACECQVHLTDLPQLVKLIEKNRARNFHENEDCQDLHSVDEQYFIRSFSKLKHAQGTVSVNILDWADPTTFPTEYPYDVIIGADIVASLYDPIALVDTMHILSTSSTKLFISGKRRLDLPHEIFETELRKRFLDVRRIPLDTCRQRNPDVFLFIISEKVI